MTPIRSEFNNEIIAKLYFVDDKYFVCLGGGRYHLISEIQAKALLEETTDDFCDLVSFVDSLRAQRQDNIKVEEGVFATRPMTPDRFKQIKQALNEFSDPNPHGSVTFKVFCEYNYPDLVIDAHDIWIDRHKFTGGLNETTT